jgi:hypothetical protein
MLVVGGRGVLVLEDALAARENGVGVIRRPAPRPSRASPSAVAPLARRPGWTASARGALYRCGAGGRLILDVDS